MADRNVHKRCSCRDPQTREILGSRCPKLRRANRSWNPTHGSWAFQLELPATAEGCRRQLRRAGLTTRADAVRELDHARAALALAGRDRTARSQIADLLQRTMRCALPLPHLDELGRRLRTASPLTDIPTVGEWLPVWGHEAQTRSEY